VDPVPDPLLFFLVMPGIEPGSPDLAKNLTTKPQRRSQDRQTRKREKSVPVNIPELSTISVAQINYRGMVRLGPITNFKLRGWKWSWPNLRHYPGNCAK
jgi:hypothetical protein